MMLVPVLLTAVLICAIAWFLSRRERYGRWKTVLLFLFCLVGGVVGNLVMGKLDDLSMKYLYFSVLGVAAGSWLAFLLFRKLF